MRDEGLANWLADNGLGENGESGKKRLFLSAREKLVDFFQNLRLKFFRRLLTNVKPKMPKGIRLAMAMLAVNRAQVVPVGWGTNFLCELFGADAKCLYICIGI